MGKKNVRLRKDHVFVTGVLLLSAFVLFSSFTSTVFAGVGDPNATVITRLEVGNVFPEILNVSVEDDAASVSLNANSTRTVYCAAVVRDYNGEADVDSVNATFYDFYYSSAPDADDNNHHYTNTSCFLNLSFGSYNGYSDDAYHLLANCSFQVQYYANASEWICNVTANDTYGWMDTNHDRINISQLLAVGLPDTIDYGLVNATAVSDENQTNVSNYGNVDLNISLEGYAKVQGDGNAMNCSLGALENISVEHEKFNLTNSSPGDITLAQTTVNYTNLTTSPSIRDFDLTRRISDVSDDTITSTYWRIYVPTGVAGNCTGNIIFGATTANGV